MKQSKTIVDTRREKVFNLLQERGTVKVDELVEKLNVSPLTVRRDLQYLEDKKLVERFYGGAMMVNKVVVRNDVSQNKALCKHAIAKHAAQFVEDGDIIFINTSSTALAVLDYIKHKKVTVITNNGKAIFVKRHRDVSVILTGGELREPKESMVGEFAIAQLQNVTANKCFLGCSGITSQTGLTTAIPQEVPINQLMFDRCTGTRFILCDHTKIGRDSYFKSNDLGVRCHLITDTGASRLPELENIKNAGVKITTLVPLKRLD